MKTISKTAMVAVLLTTTAIGTMVTAASHMSGSDHERRMKDFQEWVSAEDGPVYKRGIAKRATKQLPDNVSKDELLKLIKGEDVFSGLKFTILSVAHNISISDMTSIEKLLVSLWEEGSSYTTAVGGGRDGDWITNHLDREKYDAKYQVYALKQIHPNPMGYASPDKWTSLAIVFKLEK